MLQSALLLLLTSVLAIADNSAEMPFGIYEISQSSGPYSLRVPISNESSEVTFTTDDDDVFIVVNGTCKLNSSIAFAFSCPVECSLQPCHVNINLPEVSFFETLMVKVNETHEDFYIHDIPSFESLRPVFTQERGPFILTTILPGMPRFVYIHMKRFYLQTQDGTCVIATIDGPIPCKVVQVGKYYRLTMFIPEIQGITSIYVVADQPSITNAKYRLRVEHTSAAFAPDRIFGYESGSLSKKSENDTELELAWQLLFPVDVSGFFCYSASQMICGDPEPCVLKKELNRTVMKAEVKRGEERLSFYTCEYETNNQFDMVSFRHHWSGLDDFRGKNKAWQSAYSVIELKWLLNYRGSPEQQKLMCFLNGKPLCSGVTNTSQWGMCQLSFDNQSYALIHVAKRTASTNISRYACRTESDSQTQTIYWHEYTTPVTNGSLARSMTNYLKEAKIVLGAEEDFLVSISPDSVFTTRCVTASGNWTCEFQFRNANISLLKDDGTTNTLEQIPLTGRSYKISGMYEICDEMLMTNLHKKQLLDEFTIDLDSPNLSNCHTGAVDLCMQNIFSKGPILFCPPIVQFKE